ncbi:hypothetical protein BH09MYX1_BH09MYX1_03150 [soil metagenome]
MNTGTTKVELRARTRVIRYLPLIGSVFALLFSLEAVITGGTIAARSAAAHAFLPMLPALALAAGGCIAGYYVLRALYRMRTHERSVAIDESGLRVDGKPMLTRGAIGGMYVPRRAGTPAKVVLNSWRARVDVGVRDEAHAHELLSALGLDPTRRVTAFYGRPRVLTVTGIFNLTSYLFTPIAIAIAAIAFGTHAIPVAMLAGSAVTIASFLTAGMMRIHVGGDGILLKARFDSEFIRREDVIGILPTWNGVRLRLRSRDVDLRLNRGAFNRVDTDSRAALIGLVERMIRGESRDALVGAQLEQGDRPAAAWLRGMIADVQQDRTAETPLDELRTVLESTGSRSAAIGAAALLAKHGNADDRERIRVAAVSRVEPKVRIALGILAEGADDERIDEVVATLDARA